MPEYDAIIAGASFAGLIAADNIEGNILLIDRKEIGSGQTSACATFTSVLEGLGCSNSILQEFDTLVYRFQINITMIWFFFVNVSIR